MLHEVSGHTFDVVYDIYLTTDRVIAVLIRHPANVASSASWTRMFIGGLGSRRKEDQKLNEIAAERHDKSQKLSPDELLALNPLPSGLWLVTFKLYWHLGFFSFFRRRK